MLLRPISRSPHLYFLAFFMYLSIFHQNTALYFRQHCRLNICRYWLTFRTDFKTAAWFWKMIKKYIFPRFSSFWNRSKKDTLHWTRKREKPNGKALMIEANFEKILCQCWKNTMQIMEKYFALNLDTRKAQWKNVRVKSKFWKKYFANVEKILCKCWKFWKETLHWTWTREKPNGETLVLEANLEYDCGLESSFWIVKRSFASHSFYF